MPAYALEAWMAEWRQYGEVGLSGRLVDGGIVREAGLYGQPPG